MRQRLHNRPLVSTNFQASQRPRPRPRAFSASLDAFSARAPAPAPSGFPSVFGCISMLELPSARARARSSGFPGYDHPRFSEAPWAARWAPCAVKGSRGYDHFTSQRIKLLLEVSHLVFERLETCNLASQRDDIVHHHAKLRNIVLVLVVFLSQVPALFCQLRDCEETFLDIVLQV